MENSNILVKSAVMATVVIILLATLLSPVITDAAYNHIVQSNDGAVDGLDLDYYATALDGYPGCTITSNSDGTVAIAYPNTTKTVCGDAILIVGDSGTISSFIKSGSLCFRQADGTVLEGVKSVTLTAADGATVEASVIKSDDTSAVESIAGTGWFLPTLGGAYGSYTGDIAYDLSDVVAVGYFAGAYITSKNGDIISTNPYNLSATIERDTDGNITGVKYAKATAEAAAVDGSASAYTGEDPVILTPDDDGTVAVVTPEEWDGEDAAASTTSVTYTQVDGINYTINSPGNAAIAYGPVDSTQAECTIPEAVTIGGTVYPVKTLDTGWRGNTALTKISLPDSITRIESYAFQGCTALSTINLPDSITTLGYNMFENCKSLTQVTMPAGITFVNTGEFKNCTALSTVNLPDSITSIKPYAFQGCTALSTINLPDSISAISERAFEDCKKLTLASLPTQLKSLDAFAFLGCPAITSLIIQSSLTVYANALPPNLSEVLNLGSTTLTTAMGITDNTVVSDSIESLAVIQQKSADYYEEKGSEYTLLLIIPILMIVALLYAVISAYRTKMS